MQYWLKKIALNRYFLLFILLFAYIQSIYMRITVWQHINAYTFTPEAALANLFKALVLFAILSFLIRKWRHADPFHWGELLKIFAISLIAYLVVMKLIGLVIAYLFNNIERNFNAETFSISMFADLLDGIIYGSFYLVYVYYNKSKQHEQKLARTQQVVSESRIAQLKSQLNPHFLFNNLNVLDQLIEEDKDKASEFLNEFADIYRYVLQASDLKTISLDDELAFAHRYFNLIQHKYGKAYQLNTSIQHKGGYIIPLTLQVLIENAVQHNLGDELDPVQIEITMDEQIRVTNNIRKKRHAKATNGRALHNLKEQYSLITDSAIAIEETAHRFTVTIPIIEQKIP